MVAAVARPFIQKGASQPSFSDTIYPLLAEGAEKIKAALWFLWETIAYYGPIVGKKILSTTENGFTFCLRWIKDNPHDAKVVFLSVTSTLVGLIIIRKILSIFTAKPPSNALPTGNE